MYQRLVDALKEERPELVAPYLAKLEEEKRQAEARKRAWGHVSAAGAGAGAGAAAGETAGFTFDFGEE